MEYRIDDLARAAEVTVRNVRAYQDRGLLPPPRREGRVAWYGDGHLARLRLISSLLDRGFTLGNIGELIDGWHDGRNIGDLIDLGRLLTGPFSDEVPDRGSIEEITGRYGIDLEQEEALEDAFDFGLIRLEGEEVVVPSPRLLRAGIELRDAGVPSEALIGELRNMRTDIEAMAQRFVAVVTTYLFEPHMVDGLPRPEKVPELTELLNRIRPLATTVVTSELARALEKVTAEQYGERINALLSSGQDTEVAAG